MKKVLLIILLGAINIIALAGDLGNGGNGGSGGTKGPDIIPTYPIKPSPKDNSGCNLLCVFDNGCIFVSFEQPEGRATMTVTRMEDGVSQTAVFYTLSTFSYNIGTAPGSYVINVRTSQCEYEGFLTIE